MKVRGIVFSENIVDLPTPDSLNVTKAVINPTYILRPKYMPTNYSFHVLVMFDDLTEQKYDVIFRFRYDDEGSTPLHEMPASFENPGVQDPLPPELVGVNIDVHLNNVPVEQSGYYVFEIIVNDKLLGSDKVYITKA